MMRNYKCIECGSVFEGIAGGMLLCPTCGGHLDEGSFLKVNKAESESSEYRGIFNKQTDESDSLPPEAPTEHPWYIQQIKNNPPLKNSPPRPWVRFWARLLDLIILGLLTGLIFVLVFPKWSGDILGRKYGEDVFSLLILPFVFVVEAFVISIFGNTPAKAILRIKIFNERGRDLSFTEALKRGIYIYFAGLVAGLPIPIIPQLVAYIKLKRHGKTAWDKRFNFTVTHSHIGGIRVSAVIILYICIICIAVFEGYSDRMNMPKENQQKPISKRDAIMPDIYEQEADRIYNDMFPPDTNDDLETPPAPTVYRSTTAEERSAVADKIYNDMFGRKMPKNPLQVTVQMSDEVKKTWTGAILLLQDKFEQSEKHVAVKLHSDYLIGNGDTALQIMLGDFLPDFSINGATITSASNEPNNPAIRVVVIENGREIYKGWLYSKFPKIHPIQHERYSITLLQGIRSSE
ncbi:MAG: DUF2155 domain-containing protein [Thermodesulfovibrionales bacterium]|nr:DUF2155 domain-containing protein [Thermodesulfovibrionales bacterium]